MALQPGDPIGPYQIEEQLGTGGMATVYKAYHAKLDRRVAIKMMHPQLLEDPNFQARFEREARLVARLDHPNIVPVYDFSEYERQPYLVMKSIDGVTLKGLVREGALSLDEILRLMGALAGALDAAHKQGVLHRDLKPSNIIIDTAGTPYITDFGLARLALSGESTMSADMMLGTPQYISPEQARGDKQIDHRTDLYSFGIILYELTVGRVPFSADTAYATVHDQIYNPPPPPSEFNPEITPLVEAVLLKAIAKDPAERYPSAKALIQALTDALRTSGLNELDPERASQAVPVSFSQSPIPPAVKEASVPSVNPFEAAGEELGERLGRMGEAFDRRGSRSQWRPGAKWRQNGPGGAGFYTKDELKAAEAQSPPEERMRKFVEKKLEERTGVLIHFSIYLLVNMMIIGGSLVEGDFGIWSLAPAFFWGIGMFAHFMSYYSQYGGGRNRREEMIEREIERERLREYGTKAKNDDLSLSAAQRIRLTEDGELTDSTIEQLDADQKRKRS